MAMTSTEAPYIKVNTETKECFFRSFEIINATFVAKRSAILKLRLSNSTHMSLRLTVKKRARVESGLGRHLQGINQAINVNGKKDKYRLCFKPKKVQKKKFKKRMRGKQPSLGVGQQLGQNSVLYPSLEEIFYYGGVNPKNEDKVARNIVLVINKAFEEHHVAAIEIDDEEFTKDHGIHPCPWICFKELDMC